MTPVSDVYTVIWVVAVRLSERWIFCADTWTWQCWKDCKLGCII